MYLGRHNGDLLNVLQFADPTIADAAGWELNDGVLTITDDACMMDYSCDLQAPWTAQQSEILSVVISEGITSVGDFAFFFCDNLSSVTLPQSVTEIGEYAFAHCSALADVTLPETLTRLGKSAFTHCDGLTEITIPDAITIVEGHTFEYCNSLTTVTLPKSLKEIGYGAFVACPNLTDIYYPHSKDQWNYLEIAAGQFNMNKVQIHCVTFIDLLANFCRSVIGFFNRLLKLK